MYIYIYRYAYYTELYYYCIFECTSTHPSRSFVFWVQVEEAERPHRWSPTGLDAATCAALGLHVFELLLGEFQKNWMFWDMQSGGLGEMEVEKFMKWKLENVQFQRNLGNLDSICGIYCIVLTCLDSR